MRWIYRIAALGLLPFGLYSIMEDLPRLWAGSEAFLELTGVGALVGFAILLPGILNLLNDSYGSRAPGLRMATLGVNVLMALLFIRLEGISGERGMFLLLPVLFAVLSVYSLGLVIREGKNGVPAEGSSSPAGSPDH